jgi:hypothetical protein
MDRCFKPYNTEDVGDDSADIIKVIILRGIK